MPARSKSRHRPVLELLQRRLKEARENAGVTQVELAERLGMPQSFVSKYEHGERALDVAEFVAVTTALRLDPCALLQELQRKLRRGR